MASLYDNFVLGVDGFTDAIGLTTNKAADEYAAQTAQAQGLTDEQAATIRSNAEDLEAGGGVLSTAASATAKDVEDTAIAVSKATGKVENNVLQPLIWPALIVVLGLFLWFAGPALAPALKAALPKGD